MSEIKISLPEVSDTASQIRNYNTSLDEILAYVTKTMNELDGVWDSDGQRTLLSRFRNFTNRFAQESEVIESYARFLDDTVANYDSLESTIVSNASNFD